MLAPVIGARQRQHTIVQASVMTCRRGSMCKHPSQQLARPDSLAGGLKFICASVRPSQPNGGHSCHNSHATGNCLDLPKTERDCGLQSVGLQIATWKYPCLRARQVLTRILEDCWHSTGLHLSPRMSFGPINVAAAATPRFKAAQARPLVPNNSCSCISRWLFGQG